MQGKKKRAIEFEKSVKSFFERLKFSDVDGASDSFMINGVQVDVCAGHEETLLVVECTMKQELGKKSLKEKIKLFRGGADSLKKGFRRHPVYSKYKNFKFILATKNIEVRPEDITFANEHLPRVSIWDDNHRDYYEDLYVKIKDYAKFNLLGELHIRPLQQNAVQIPAFQTMIDDVVMYYFLIDPRLLLEVSYVARAEAKNERYYQRIIKRDRLNKISQYINDENGMLPNNLIIAFGDYISKFLKFYPAALQSHGYKMQLNQFGVLQGILEFPRDYRSCWIIDGQHRLYSFINVEKALTMPVVAFKNLKIDQQCKIFLDINKNQKPVPSDLVWDLNGDMLSYQDEGKISNTVKKLNELA
ncbi:DGQHR domain-containing protein, partial [Candidatus Omnitrophota bacterium]